jgi:hypothetical protein
MSAWTDAAWSEAYVGRDAVIFHEQTIQAAAIAHTCTACNTAIEAGRPYRRQVGMNKGDAAPWVTKEHLPDCYAETTH